MTVSFGAEAEGAARASAGGKGGCSDSRRGLCCTHNPCLVPRAGALASVVREKKKFTDFSVARAPHPHQSLPDPLTPPLLSLSPNPSPYHPFREGVLGRDASDITFLTRSPSLIS
eukprot:scaffold13889_cov160-Isochrysis_galbana.AAC.2